MGLHRDKDIFAFLNPKKKTMKKNLMLALLLWLSIITDIQSQTIWSDNFNDDNIDDWTLIDGDGDGFNFQTIQMLGGWPPSPIGTPFLSSTSYTQYNNIGNVFPDNWAITPAIDLTSVGPDKNVSLQWAIVDSATSWNPYPNNENYAIYIAETKDTNDFISGGIKFTEHNLPIIYTVRVLDVSEFIGKTIYIAFRHYNVSDSVEVPFSSSLELDDMSVFISISSSVQPANFNTDLMIYPNPADGLIEVATPSGFNAHLTTYELLGITGNIIATFNSNNGKINLSNIPSGVYILKATDGQHTTVQKLVRK